MSSKLLINEPPLQVLPSLAKAIGLNNAIALQQLHYWLGVQQKAGNDYCYREGKWWCYNTYEEWRDNNFPWWSRATIVRIFTNLRNIDLAITKQFRAAVGDHTLWYTINYETLNNLEIQSFQKADPDLLKMSRSNLSKRADPHRQSLLNLSRSTYTETSITENTEEPDPETEKLHHELAKLWGNALADLQLKMPSSTFDTWLKGTHIGRDENTITIYCHNAFAVDWLSRRLAPKIKATLADLLDEDVAVEYELQS